MTKKFFFVIRRNERIVDNAYCSFNNKSIRNVDDQFQWKFELSSTTDYNRFKWLQCRSTEKSSRFLSSTSDALRLGDLGIFRFRLSLRDESEFIGRHRRHGKTKVRLENSTRYFFFFRSLHKVRRTSRSRRVQVEIPIRVNRHRYDEKASFCRGCDPVPKTRLTTCFIFWESQNT